MAESMKKMGISYIGGTANAKEGVKVTAIELTQKEPDAKVVLNFIKEKAKP